MKTYEKRIKKFEKIEVIDVETLKKLKIQIENAYNGSGKYPTIEKALNIIRTLGGKVDVDTWSYYIERKSKNNRFVTSRYSKESYMITIDFKGDHKEYIKHDSYFACNFWYYMMSVMKEV